MGTNFLMKSMTVLDVTRTVMLEIGLSLTFFSTKKIWENHVYSYSIYDNLILAYQIYIFN